MRSVKKLVLSALCLALCLVLPFLTGQIPQLGNALCPMHLPVLLCGFLCGPLWAGGIGLIAPLLRYVLFHMPPIYPTAFSMCFELATYGLVSGLLYRRLPEKFGWLYLSLIVAMVAGRLVWGAVRAIISGAGGAAFTWTLFLTEGFVNAIPGIIVQLILIPAIVTALQKARVIDHPRTV